MHKSTVRNIIVLQLICSCVYFYLSTFCSCPGKVIAVRCVWRRNCTHLLLRLSLVLTFESCHNATNQQSHLILFLTVFYYLQCERFRYLFKQVKATVFLNSNVVLLLLFFFVFILSAFTHVIGLIWFCAYKLIDFSIYGHACGKQRRHSVASLIGMTLHIQSCRLNFYFFSFF